MRTRFGTLACVATMALLVGGPLKTQPVLADGQACVAVNGQYSWRLKATFVIQKMHIPGYTFYAARIVSPPAYDSPLRQLHLRMGDVITRLDGIPVDNFAELDNHVAQTYVRYIRQGTTQPHTSMMFIGWGGGGPVSGGGTTP